MQSQSVCLNYCCWSRIELGLLLLLLLEFNGVLHKLFIKVKKKEIRLSYTLQCVHWCLKKPKISFSIKTCQKDSLLLLLCMPKQWSGRRRKLKKRRSHDIHANLPCPCVLFHSEGFCEKEEIFVKKMWLFSHRNYSFGATKAGVMQYFNSNSRQEPKKASVHRLRHNDALWNWIFCGHTTTFWLVKDKGICNSCRYCDMIRTFDALLQQF